MCRIPAENACMAYARARRRRCRRTTCMTRTHKPTPGIQPSMHADERAIRAAVPCVGYLRLLLFPTTAVKGVDVWLEFQPNQQRRARRKGWRDQTIRHG